MRWPQGSGQPWASQIGALALVALAASLIGLTAAVLLLWSGRAFRSSDIVALTLVMTGTICFIVAVVSSIVSGQLYGVFTSTLALGGLGIFCLGYTAVLFRYYSMMTGTSMLPLVALVSPVAYFLGMLAIPVFSEAGSTHIVPPLFLLLFGAGWFGLGLSSVRGS
ncbi:MAG: hypothetical protein IT340_07340 [Chloroflexi bacterium]|nr:hypothetical protein [Chloroflexota bacterium]